MSLSAAKTCLPPLRLAVLAKFTLCAYPECDVCCYAKVVRAGWTANMLLKHVYVIYILPAHVVCAYMFTYVYMIYIVEHVYIHQCSRSMIMLSFLVRK